MIAEAQKMGGEAAFIDAEHALDPVYAKKLGVDIDNLNSITTRHRRTSIRDSRSISKKWST